MDVWIPTPLWEAWSEVLYPPPISTLPHCFLNHQAGSIQYNNVSPYQGVFLSPVPTILCSSDPPSEVHPDQAYSRSTHQLTLPQHVQFPRSSLVFPKEPVVF